MNPNLTVFAFILFGNFITGVESNYKKLYNVFGNLTENYNRVVRPHPTGSAVDVGVNMFILGIPKVDEKAFEFSLDMYFRQFWTDDRLRFSSRGADQISHMSLRRQVWTPDTFFYNQKEGKFIDNLGDNTFFRITNNGEIIYSSRQVVTLYCNMEMALYPFDVQKCNLEIESFGNKISDIKYFWKDGDTSVKVGDDIKNPSFKILGYKLGESTVTISTGDYSRLSVTFFVKREQGKFIRNYVVPSALVMLISWVAFWLHPADESGCRALTILFSTLALLALYSKASSQLVVGYATYMDLFFLGCLGLQLVNAGVFILSMLAKKSSRQCDQSRRCRITCLGRLSWFLDSVFRLAFVPLVGVLLFAFCYKFVPSVSNIEDMIPL